MSATLKDVLRNTLDDLTRADFKRFKRYLQDKSRIKWRKLEKADTDDTVDMMVQAYSMESGGVMVTILRKMNNNQLAMALERDLAKYQSGEMVNVPPMAHQEGGQGRQWAMFATSKDNNAARHMPALKVVLLGKAGTGKTATANTLCLKKDVSEKGISVTRHCESKKGMFKRRAITVIDTPGLSRDFNEQLRTEIKDYLEPGPHVFLLVIRLGDVVKGEDVDTVKWVEENLGKDVFCYIIVLFTCADQLQDIEIEDYCRQSNFLRSLINACGGRYHLITNIEEQPEEEVKKLIDNIDELVWWNFNEGNYNRECYDEAQREIKKKEKEAEKQRRWMKTLYVVKYLAVIVVIGGLIYIFYSCCLVHLINK